jgi:hypothetical protein
MVVAPAQWHGALARLVADDGLRRSLIDAAQAKLVRDYAPERLEDQVLRVLQTARDHAAARTGPSSHT